MIYKLCVLYADFVKTQGAQYPTQLNAIARVGGLRRILGEAGADEQARRLGRGGVFDRCDVSKVRE